MSASPSRVIGLFSTPLMHSRGVIGGPAVDRLASRFAGQALQANAKSAQLSHTAILHPAGDDMLAQVGEAVLPHLQAFGELLFGQRLPWTVKEMWCNVLEAGGHQAVHNHANSFVSGVVYLSPVHAEAGTVFIRGMGQPGYVFANAHAGTATGPFNGDKWAMPEVSPGDLVLFPSWLLHEVPVNRGQQRITLALNAIPARLDSWGYTVGFTA